MDNDLLIGIVTYRSLDTIGPCVASIKRNCPNAMVSIVDNSGEVDQIQRRLRAQLGIWAKEHIVFDENRSNLGYARGVNTAFRHSDGELLFLVLNPDVVIASDPHVFATGLAKFSIVSGVLAPSSEVPTWAPNARPIATIASEMSRAVAGSRLQRRFPWESGKWCRVPQLDGAYLMTTSDWYAAHPMDESFELYYEDVDLCRRAGVDKGCGLLGVTAGIHLGGASFGKASEMAYRAHRVSRARYLAKWYPRAPMVLLAAPFVLEYATRCVIRKEPEKVRREAMRRALSELRDPMSQHVLS